jgi:hypothetical protein
MNHAASIAVRRLVFLGLLLGGCGEKSANEGSLGSSAPQAGSGPAGTGKDVVPTLDESVEYLDGETPRKLWLSKDLVAEFKPSDAGRAAVLAADPGAQEMGQPQPVLRIWKLAGPKRGEEFARAVWNPALIVSPVLHEGPSETLPIRALPGGVLVTFKPDWDRPRIEGWLTSKSLQLDSGEPVVAEANMWLVQTVPGLPALLVANELKKTGELVDVVPNFWRQNAAR